MRSGSRPAESTARGRATDVIDASAVSERTRRRSLRRLGLVVTAALAVGLVLAASSLGLGAETNAGLADGEQFVRWPVDLEYEVTNLGSGPEAGDRRAYRFEGKSWASWRQEQTCCDPIEVGYRTELRDDGQLWEGGNDHTPMVHVLDSPDPAGLVPIADFAPKYPFTSEVALQDDPRIELIDAEGDGPRRANRVAVADRLGVAIDDLTSFRVRGSDGEVATYVVHTGLGLVLERYEESRDGQPVRHVRVLALTAE